MKENCRKKAEGTGEQERREIIRSLCKRYVKQIKLCGYNWRKLSAFADKAYGDAARAFERKNYQEFELNLLLYSDVWLYAHAHLKQHDFRCFCLSQYKAPAAAVQ